MERKTLGDFISIYEKFAAAENKSQRTIETVKYAAGKFDSYLGTSPDVTDIKAEDLRRYIRHLQAEPRWSGHPTINGNHGNLSPGAIAAYVRSIRSFWSWLKREKFIDENPFEQVKPPKVPQRVVNPLIPDEVLTLLKVIPRQNHTGYRNCCIILTMYGTGLRVSEVIDLPLDDVNFDSAQIKVMGKGKKERAVYMSASVYKALFKYRHQRRPRVESEYFFIHEDGRPLNRSYVEHQMQRYVKKAGMVSTCTPHILRYSFAIQFIRNGGDPFTLQKILGHSTLDMTRRYVQIANSDVEEKMKAFSPAEQLGVRL